MTSRRLLFVCYPDTNQPIGGVKQIYRQVELLHKAGWDAYVLQEQPGFRADWFSAMPPVLDLEAYKASPPSIDNDLWCCRKHGSPTCPATCRASPR